jgi:hypothetical protein
MPHLRTDDGVDLDLERGDLGEVRITIAPHSVDELITGGLVLSPGEARMIGAYLNPASAPAAAAAPTPPPAPARARRYDPSTGTLPADWLELADYARHMSGRGLEVAIAVPVAVPDLEAALNGEELPGVTVTIDDGVVPPGKFTVGRNGQRIATYHLGRNAAQGR